MEFLADENFPLLSIRLLREINHSYVESKGNNVAVLDNVVLAFQP